MKSSLPIAPGKIISQRFVISKKIGEGSFGTVYQGYDIQLGIDIAIKLEEFEKNDEKMKKESLLKEAKFLYELKGQSGVPKMTYFVKTETKRILMMTLLGMNLESMFQRQKRRFSLKTVLSLAEQMLTRLQQIHGKDIIHRDLKPENFLLSNDPNEDLIYLVDFGLSKKFRLKGVHIVFKKNIGLVGTARYASLNAHIGNDQSRRDDLESLIYILIYFLKGTLPWMNLNATNKEEKHKLIIEKKRNTPFQKLCEGLPFEFEQYLNYVRCLDFDEDPNYEYLKTLFKRIAMRNNFDYGFEWRMNKPVLHTSEKIIEKIQKQDETNSLYDSSSRRMLKNQNRDTSFSTNKNTLNSFQYSVKILLSLKLIKI